MLLQHNISLSRIILNTWQVDLIMIASSTLAYLAHDNLFKYHIENIPVIVPTVLGTAIAFFIGFNNNQAYDRWWEGRKIWGAIVNDSRSWARDVLSYVEIGSADSTERKQMQQKLICRQIAWLYALKGNLRGVDDQVYKTYLSAEDLGRMEGQKNKHNAILLLQSHDLQQFLKTGAVDGFRYLQMDTLLVRLSDYMGMAERIKNTVFPTTYNYLTKVFIWLFVVFIALVTSEPMGAWAIFVSWLVGFVFISTQINGMNLVDPFNSNIAALPLNQIARTIEINLLEMMGEDPDKIPPAITPVNDEYVL